MAATYGPATSYMKLACPSKAVRNRENSAELAHQMQPQSVSGFEIPYLIGRPEQAVRMVQMRSHKKRT